MAGLKQIKVKIRSIEKTRKVTKAMEAVSAAKMRKAQLRALGGRPYARAAVSILARVSGSKELARHALTQHRNVHNAIYIVITSDKGLAGALNSGVLKVALQDITARGLSRDNVQIIAVGKKARDFFSKRGYNVERFHDNAGDVVPHELVHEIVAEAAHRFGTNSTDLVQICYQHFVSTFEQRPTVRSVFPLSLDELQKVVQDIVPAKGKFSDAGEEGKNPTVYTIEPSATEVLNAILPRLAGIFVYHALLESRASEHSARMVAMKNATDKGGELQHSLTLQFNKARQAAITREVSEITGGIEAMAV